MVFVVGVISIAFALPTASVAGDSSTGCTSSAAGKVCSSGFFSVFKSGLVSTFDESSDGREEVLASLAEDDSVSCACTPTVCINIVDAVKNDKPLLYSFFFLLFICDSPFFSK